MTKQEILNDELCGWELFPNTSKEEAEILLHSIYEAMGKYAEQEVSKVLKDKNEDS